MNVLARFLGAAGLTVALTTSAVAQQTETEPNNSSTTATVIAVGQDAHGTINQAGDVDFFAFDVDAGTQLEFYLRFPENWTPTQWLIDRDGETAIEKRDWSTRGEKLIRQVIPTSGRYFVRIASYNGGSGFTYTVRLQRYTPPRSGPSDPIARFYAPSNSNMTRFGDIAAGSSGEVFVTWSGGAIRARQSGSTETGTDVHNRHGYPESLTIDGYGNLLISACESEPDIPCRSTAVWKISPTGERSKFFTIPDGVRAMVAGPDGDVWIADAGLRGERPRLYRLDPDGLPRDTLDVDAWRIRFSPGGQLHYTTGTNGLYKLVNDQPQQVIAPAREEWFGDFVFDQDGWIYLVASRSEGHENWDAVSRLLLYDAQYRLQRDPLAEVDDNFAQFSVGPLAFLRDANGAMTNRLVAIHNGYRLGIPTTSLTEIVELNSAGMGAPGVRIGVDLSPVTLASSEQGHVGSNYSNTVRMQDAPAGIRWTVERGSLPPGVTLNETSGELKGVPSQTGSYTFSVRPRSGARVGFGRFTVSVESAQALEIDATALHSGALGTSYLDTLRVKDTSDPVTWSITSGRLPPGIVLAANTGIVSGTPTDTGAFGFSVAATTGPRQGSGQFTILVAPVAVSTLDIVNALLGTATLTPGLIAFLDQHGNRNGKLDVGDLRAFLRTQGMLPSGAEESDRP